MTKGCFPTPYVWLFLGGWHWKIKSICAIWEQATIFEVFPVFSPKLFQYTSIKTALPPFVTNDAFMKGSPSSSKVYKRRVSNIARWRCKAPKIWFVKGISFQTCCFWQGQVEETLLDFTGIFVSILPYPTSCSEQSMILKSENARSQMI